MMAILYSENEIYVAALLTASASLGWRPSIMKILRNGRIILGKVWLYMDVEERHGGNLDPLRKNNVSFYRK